MNRLFTSFLFVIYLSSIFFFLITLASSQETSYGDFNRHLPINLVQECDCTYVNITSITFKGFSIQGITFPISMTKVGTHFNASISSTTDYIGKYIVTGEGNPAGIRTPFASSYKIKMRDGIFSLNFDDTLTIVFLAILVIAILTFIFFRLFFFSGVIMVILALLLLFNGFSFIISMLLLIGGIFFSITK